MELQIIAKLINNKNFSEAKTKLINLINEGAESDNIYFTLSQVCIQLNELENAKKYLEKHLQNKPKDCEALLNLGNIYLKTLEIYKVEKIYKKILKIDKNYLPALSNLAFFYEGVGKIKNAKKYYESAKKLDPNNLNFFYNLIRLNPKYIDEKNVRFLENIIKKKKVPKKNEFLANFILSKNYEKKKDYKNEIKYLKLSHENYLKNNLNKISYKYWLEIIPDLYNKFIYKKFDKSIFKNINPIFIVGLPRSGSTITELILSSSNTPMKTISESSMINSILINNYRNQIFNNYKKNNFELDISFIEKKIITFFKNFNFSNFDKKTFIDKSLENFFYIDLIVKIFPKAKFIITERNINDNIIGIYKKLLLDISWSHSIQDIIKYIDNYIKIIEFYKKRYKEKIYFVKLDDLQNLNKVKARELFEFCDLKFNQNCFDFQKNFQFVNNASNIQIRNILEKYDNKKYEKYFSLLEGSKEKYPWIK